MRIYTKVVWEWRGDELVQTEAHSYEYEGPVDLAKGGSSAPQNYANLERLYGIQADQAEFLGETFKGTVAPAYKNWLGEAQDYGSQANQEQAAERAGKAVSGATSESQRALEENMQSMGLNPGDQRYQAQLGQMGIQGGAQQAAAMTTARESTRDKGFARTQDAIGMGMGTPTQASQAANSAANSATSSLAAQNQAQQNQANSVGNIVRAGTNIWGAYNDYGRNSGGGSGGGGGGWADGGEVTQPRGILRLKGGGYVQRLARGGFAGGSTPGGTGGGFMASPQVTAPPPSRPPPPPSGAEQAAGAGSSAIGTPGLKMGIGKAAEMGGNAANSPTVSAFGKGMQMSPSDARAAGEVYNAAAKKAAEAAVDKELGAQGYQNGVQAATPAETDTALASAQAGAAQDAAASQAALEATQTGAATAADAESALAASQAAEAAAAADAAAAATAGEAGLAASGAGLGAAAAVGTAVPVIGAGLALYGIGNAAGWWADGGVVNRMGGGARGAATAANPGPVFRTGDMSSQDAWDPGHRAMEAGRNYGWWKDGGDVTPGSNGAAGGEVDGPGGPKDDEIIAALSDGEFVMPVGAVKYFGIDRLEKMRQKGLEHEKTLGITR